MHGLMDHHDLWSNFSSLFLCCKQNCLAISLTDNKECKATNKALPVVKVVIKYRQTGCQQIKKETKIGFNNIASLMIYANNENRARRNEKKFTVLQPTQ